MVLCCGSRRDKTVVHFSSDPVKLPTSLANANAASLKELVKTRCPSLFTDFETKWWLNSGHVQTIYSVFADLTKTDQVRYRRQYLRLADGGTLGLDFAPIDDQPSDETPIIVVSHGLTGSETPTNPTSKQSSLEQSLLSPVEDWDIELLWSIIAAVEGRPITSQRFYMAGETEDLRQALAYLSYKYPRAPLHGLGFSLGANMITRYVAQEGTKSRLWSACVLANPWDFNANSIALNSTYHGYYVYNRALGHNTKTLVTRHLTALTTPDPTHPMATYAQRLMSLPKPTLTEYDDAFSRFVGGREAWESERKDEDYYPFESVAKFYDHVSSHHLMHKVKVPLLGINAKDDPIVQHIPTMGDGGKDEESPCTVMAITSGGGHLGWFTDGSGDRWTTGPVLEWFKMVVEDIRWERLNIERGARVYVDGEGFIREEGRLLLGCKEVEGGGVVDGNDGEKAVLRGL
ncbi:hypothetical protein AAF712_007933 [Marasmius tenuissimus]|uniref:AB hydrolase-1 domain-containing protein n=1 Tax=Marasmius tenuissimus TaxID=585030 RepID=A0ABR2ZXT1_9AGAR